MKLGFREIVAVAVACLFGAPQSLAQNVYIPNQSDATVSVINTATNTVRDAIGHAGVGTRTVNIQNGLLAGAGTAPRSVIAPTR